MTEENETDYGKIAANIKALADENQRLHHMKKRYIEYSRQLSEYEDNLRELQNKVSGEFISIREKLCYLAKEIDPVVKIKVKSGSARQASRDRFSSTKNMLFDKMTQGQHITLDFIRSVCTDIDESGHHNLLSGLKKMTGVKMVKDNGKLRLYI